MEMIRHLEIENYKSIKHLTLNCNKVNVIIGEPNVGKSNILEALDLSYLSGMLHQNSININAGKESIDIKKYFRVNEVADLFNDGDISKTISIVHPEFTPQTELSFIREFKSNNLENVFGWSAGHGGIPTCFNNDFIPVENAQYYSTPIKPYRYSDNVQIHDVGGYLDRLMPPYGNNITEVLKHNKSFREFVGGLIQDFDLELNIDSFNNNLFVQKKISHGIVYSMKYESIADTLRRVIFYTAAIRHNGGSVITLEEPDAHSFPKFVSFLADEIIENKKNQFFIATHSPYLLNNLIENTPSEDLAVFVCGFDKERGTTARKLSQEDLSELLDFGVDIFFNINKYSDDRVEHNS